jgi:hypothetical protein
MINLAEDRLKTRQNGSNFKHKLFYDSLSKDKVGVGLKSKPVFQPKILESPTTVQQDRRDISVSVQTTYL